MKKNIIIREESEYIEKQLNDSKKLIEETKNLNKYRYYNYLLENLIM